MTITVAVKKKYDKKGDFISYLIAMITKRCTNRNSPNYVMTMLNQKNKPVLSKDFVQFWSVFGLIILGAILFV